MLRFKLAYLQLFSDWLMYVFHFYLWGVGIFNFFKYMLIRYFCKTILTVLPDSFYDLKWPIYNSFLIGECLFSTISSGMSGIFNFFKHMSLRYFFQTILGVVQYICYNLKSPPYAPVVYVQNIKCVFIHSTQIPSPLK